MKIVVGLLSVFFLARNCGKNTFTEKGVLLLAGDDVFFIKSNQTNNIDTAFLNNLKGDTTSIINLQRFEHEGSSINMLKQKTKPMKGAYYACGTPLTPDLQTKFIYAELRFMKSEYHASELKQLNKPKDLCIYSFQYDLPYALKYRISGDRVMEINVRD